MPVRESNREVVVRLSALVSAERKNLLDEWRAQVRDLPAAKHLDTPTLNDHVPALIEEIARALNSGSEESIAHTVAEGTPPAHGVQRYEDGFDIEEVVAEYNILRGCVHDLATSHDLPLQGEPFHVLNRLLDGAIGAAVQAFAAQRAKEVKHRREEYLAFVAHDLRTPLNAISLAANFLEKGPARATKMESATLWNILKRNMQQLEALVGKVLRENVSLEAEAGMRIEQRMIDLWALVETVCMDLLPVADNAGTNIVNAVPEHLVVYADAGMVRRVFQNLVANAISVCPKGEIVVSADDRGGGRIHCVVKDDGPGIPEHRLAGVFEKLETDPANPNTSGMGLGLAIVKAFVEAHGCEVEVKSREGEGCEFQFTLPVGPDPT